MLPLLLLLALPAPGTLGVVACAERPTERYALYLPSIYSASRRWPILYVLDARGRAEEAARLFVPAAERRGWIVASAFGSTSDAGLEPNKRAIGALYTDTHTRLALAPGRAYAAGFSGTVRSIIQLALHAPGHLAGVVASGAGFPIERAPTAEVRLPIFAAVGDADFNYAELRALDDALEGLALPHRLEVFEGGHRWMPPELAERALAWLDLRAGGAADGVAAELGRARHERDAGDRLGAERRLRALVRDAPAAKEARTMLEALQADPALARDRARDAALLADERAYLTRAAATLGAASRAPRPDAARVVATLEVGALRRDAGDRAHPEHARSARRRLAELEVQAAFYLVARGGPGAATLAAELSRALAR